MEFLFHDYGPIFSLNVKLVVDLEGSIWIFYMYQWLLRYHLITFHIFISLALLFYNIGEKFM